jgi:thiamine-phosphate pyrophosphorylase
MKKKIESGVYLVVDSSYGETKVMRTVQDSLRNGLDVLQLWASWKDDRQAVELGKKLAKLASDYSVPFLVNNDLDVAIEIGADGVHIDDREPSPSRIREVMGSSSITGVTCGTQMEKVLWAESVGVDYVSFCSMFPSSSVSKCDLVPLKMLTDASDRIRLPIFASGGINLDNAGLVLEAGADGVAVISTIMGANDPGHVTRELKRIVRDYSSKRQRVTVSAES